MTDPANGLTCEKVLGLLDDYRRETLSPVLRQQVAAHLEECEACAAELARRENLAQLVRASLPAAPPPPRQLTSAVHDAIRTQHRDSIRQRSSRSNMLPWMLAAAVLLVTGVALLQTRAPGELADAREVAVTSRPQVTSLYSESRALPPAPVPALEAAAPAELKRELAVRDSVPASDAVMEAAAPPPMMPPPGELRAETASQSQDKAALGQAEMNSAGQQATNRYFAAEAEPGATLDFARSVPAPAAPASEPDAPARFSGEATTLMDTAPQQASTRAAAVPQIQQRKIPAAKSTDELAKTATRTTAPLTTASLATTATLTQTTATETSAPK